MPRRPKPTALRLLEGNAGHRPINGREPNLRVANPRPPDYLSARARKEWTMLCRELAPTRMLNPVDRASLAAYCEAVARLEEATIALREIEAALASSEITVEDRGQLQYRLNLETGKRRQSAAEVLRFGVEFGLTPGSRSKIKVPDGQGELFDAAPLTDLRRQILGE